MAAPATSSTTSLVSIFQSSMDSRSVEMKKLLSITSKDLEKNGFEAKIWLKFFEHTYRPEHLARVKIAIQQEKSPQNLEKMEARTRRFEQAFKNALEQLQLLPSNKKAWKNYPGEIEKAIHWIFELVAEAEGVFLETQAPISGISELEEAIQKHAKNDEIHAAVCNHLIHLLVDRIRLELNPNHENCFVLRMDEKPKIAIEENGIWRLTPILNQKDTSLKFQVWSAVPGPFPSNSTEINGMETHAILTKGTEIIFRVPFIGISFQLHPASLEVQKALATHTPLQITDKKSPCMIDAVYSRGIQCAQEEGMRFFSQRFQISLNWIPPFRQVISLKIPLYGSTCKLQSKR